MRSFVLDDAATYMLRQCGLLCPQWDAIILARNVVVRTLRLLLELIEGGK